MRYGSDGRDLFLPAATERLGLEEPVLDISLRVRPDSIELSAMLDENPADELFSELFWWWYKHPREAVYFGPAPTAAGTAGLAVFSRIALVEDLSKPRTLATLIKAAIIHMHTAVINLAQGEYTSQAAIDPKETTQNQASVTEQTIESSDGDTLATDEDVESGSR